VIAIFAGAAAEGRPVTVYGDGPQTRDYIYVDDVVSAFIAAAERDVTGAVNVGTGVETTVLELVEQMGVPAEHAPWRTGAGGAQPLAQFIGIEFGDRGVREHRDVIG